MHIKSRVLTFCLKYVMMITCFTNYVYYEKDYH